jgi:hypothetical protein
MQQELTISPHNVEVSAVKKANSELTAPSELCKSDRISNIDKGKFRTNAACHKSITQLQMISQKPTFQIV